MQTVKKKSKHKIKLRNVQNRATRNKIKELSIRYVYRTLFFFWRDLTFSYNDGRERRRERRRESKLKYIYTYGTGEEGGW